MSDQPVRTRVLRRRTLVAVPGVPDQRAGGAGPIDDVEFRGAADAPRDRRRCSRRSRGARAIVIGPSNPIISIGPILAVEELRAAIAERRAPVVAVSPIVGGKVLKGPTAAFMRWAGRSRSSAGIAPLYGGLIDGIVADEADRSVAGAADRRADGQPGRRR